MKAFDISFLDRNLDNIIQRLVLVIESHIEAEYAVLLPSGSLVYDPGAVKAYAAYYQVAEYIRTHGGQQQLQRAIKRLINKEL